MCILKSGKVAFFYHEPLPLKCLHVFTMFLLKCSLISKYFFQRNHSNNSTNLFQTFVVKGEVINTWRTTSPCLTLGQSVQFPVRLTVDGGIGDSAVSRCSRHRGGRGSCCHCQILSRAAERKQQMVELVPEQHVNSGSLVLGSACGCSRFVSRGPWWNNLCSSAGSGVFLRARRFCAEIMLRVSSPQLL